MKRDDIVANGIPGWLGRVLSVNSKGNVRLLWVDGPLKGRDALVPKALLKRRA